MEMRLPQRERCNGRLYLDLRPLAAETALISSRIKSLFIKGIKWFQQLTENYSARQPTLLDRSSMSIPN
jgi:hypothetical protein